MPIYLYIRVLTWRWVPRPALLLSVLSTRQSRLQPIVCYSELGREHQSQQARMFASTITRSANIRRLLQRCMLAVVVSIPTALFAADESGSALAAQSRPDARWPSIQFTAKPWTYWYWMGGAVDEAGISRHLEQYRAAGLGGVHIVPVYGVRGAEAKYIPFLSPRWMKLLNHAVHEADRLGMGIDMTCGTGWPFGGPWVQPPYAAAHYSLRDFSPLESELVQPEKAADPSASLVVLMAYGPKGDVLDLTSQVDSAHRLTWKPPSQDWRLTALFQSPTNLPVERAAPGGEGLTIDYFSRKSLDQYLQKFNEAFDQFPHLHVRRLYNDSYENWGQNWTPQLFDEFNRRRGYDLKTHLPQLKATDTSDEALRVRADFRETMADLIRDEFTAPWVEWAHEHHMQVRNEGHGSPGNPLDLYALADIPETEVFGTSWLEPLGLKPLPGVPEREGGAPEVQVCKLASSAAHVAGHPLCSSETCTWLGDHFKIPLEHMKAQADLMFVMGVNHIFFHGAAYSPEDAPWPGWLWYAATNIGVYMPAWEHMPALCDYIARCQSCLQSGQPDNDVLVYFPIYDLWATDEGARDNLQYTIVHSTPIWLEKIMPGFAAVGRTLWSRGYSFDCISDRQIAELSADGGRLVAPGGRYKVLIVPECRRMPEATMKHLARLVRNGATVIADKQLPDDVPGLSRLADRRVELRSATEQLKQSRSNSGKDQTGGTLLVGDDIEQLLDAAKVSRESFVDLGLKFIRRRDDQGWIYFIVNHSGNDIARWLPLAVAATGGTILDPATGRSGKAETRQTAGVTEVFVQLYPRQSVIIRATQQSSDNSEWKYLVGEQPQPLTGPWQVEFIDGGPSLPQSQRIDSLTDWTTWSADTEKLKCFSGTARYTLKFERPKSNADSWALDLGEVCHSARVRLNGTSLGTVIASPFRLDASHAIRPGANKLEIEVANLPANRIADLDRRGEDWKKFLFVDIRYHPFDASKWTPIASGLIGPVNLIAERRLGRSELNSMP